MAERPENDSTEIAPSQDEDEELREEPEEQELRADEGSELDDPREEEGWSQPESSAQKGAPRDEG